MERGLTAIAVLLTCVSCSRPSDPARVSAAAEKPASYSPVQYVKVVEQTIPDSLELAAKVQADPTKVVHIFPPASGRVVAIEVKPGDQVRRGQTVAILSSSDIGTAQSDFAKAQIEANRATRAAEREKELLEHGAAAEKDYVEAKAQADAALAEETRARQRLQLLNVSPSTATDRTVLTAPGSGVVLDVGAAPGEFSKSLDSANPLITVADLNTVWVIGDVYEKDIAQVTLGKPVTITLQAYPREPLSGHIDAISGALDAATRTLKVRVVLANREQRIKPEMFGTIEIKAGSHQGLAVPATAIIREGNLTTVFMNHGGKAEQRTVIVGRELDGKVEVVSGLEAGDEVASEGAELLKGSGEE